ncbi:MAG TPA: nicotinate phosphoribosyltransferase [Vicinamibacterales bacterium]|nr:nicotinate phosphoribosyltransferase [Vicinamibacterales bacterium]
MASDIPGRLPALFTDLYQLTMLQAYFHQRLHGRAVFSLFVRRLPAQRNYLLSCGLEAVLDYLEQLRFANDELEYLRSLELFSEPFLDWLRGFRFTGEVHAVPEGTVLFANEPILEVIAPLPEAQLIETCVMNQVHLQTVIASKAARVVVAAQGRTVIDFGARRTLGMDAAVQGARACYIAGVEATSNVLAGRLYGIPVSGTMAHSYIQATGDERAAFESFARTIPGTVLLVDTYDTLQGVKHVIELAQRTRDPIKVSAVRLDSGDLEHLAHETRRLLDAAGLRGIRIFGSSDLDEHEIERLLNAGAPIDGFGVGTGMGVSSDAPSLELVYKLTEYDAVGRTKLSTSKPVLPGRKQVYRRMRGGTMGGDVIARGDEECEGRPLLQRVMQRGRRLAALRDEQSLEAARARAHAEIAQLPRHVRQLAPAQPVYPVTVSTALQRYHASVRARISPRGGRQ